MFINSGFATFKNTDEGEVEIVGVGKNDATCEISDGDGMILSAQDLQQGNNMLEK